jgi:hypothetical protein
VQCYYFILVVKQYIPFLDACTSTSRDYQWMLSLYILNSILFVLFLCQNLVHADIFVVLPKIGAVLSQGKKETV